MAKCSKCDAEMLGTSQFCGSCGALSAAAAPPKKTVLGDPMSAAEALKAIAKSPPPALPVLAAPPPLPDSPPRVSATIDDSGSEPETEPISETTLPVGALVDSKYAIVRILGQGGMGVVYLARDVHTDLEVVLKAVRRELAHRPDLRARMLAEGRALAQIDHANVVRLNAVVARGEDFWLVMQYIDGETLDKIIASHKTQGGLPIDRAVALFRQIASGVGAAHQEGVIHRDLKPANVIIRKKDGVAKVMDFGIAKLPSRPDGAVTKGVIGSLWYMAPEQVTGRRDLDARVDVYALGILLFQMLVGRVPFNGASEYEIMKLQAEAPMPLAKSFRADVPPELDAVIQHACEKDRDKRFASCDEFIAALDQLGLATPSFGTPRSAEMSGAFPRTVLDLPPTPSEERVSEIAPAASVPEAAGVAPAEPPAAVASPTEGDVALKQPDAALAPPAVNGGVTGTGTELQIEKPRRSGAWVAILLGVLALAGAGVAAVMTGLVPLPLPLAKKHATTPVHVPIATATVASAAAPPKKPLEALAGAWIGNGRELEAVLDGDVLEFRVKNPAQFAPQDYQAGEARFTLRATSEPNVFLVEDRIRPNPPAGRGFDSHSRGTCQEVWTQTNSEPLRARFDGSRLSVEFAKIEPSDANFVVQGGKITSCVGLRELKAAKVVSTLKRN